MDDARSIYCIVGGYIASTSQWDSFKGAWQAALRKHKVRPDKEGQPPSFHSHQFFQRSSWQSSKSPYFDWADEQGDALLADLLQIIQSHLVYPIGGAIHIADFKSLDYDDRRFLTGGNILLHAKNSPVRTKWKTSGSPNRPYFAGFHLLLVEALRRSKPGSLIHFYFDRQTVVKARAVQTFHEIADGDAFADGRTQRLGGIEYVPSWQQPPLQAADLYIYSWNHYLTRDLLGLSLDPNIKVALNALTLKRDAMHVYHRPDLRRMVESMIDAMNAEIRNAPDATT